MDAQLTVCEMRDDSIHAEIKLSGRCFSYELKTRGSHFAFNALGAIAALQALGANVELAVRDISLWKPIQGRGSHTFVPITCGKIELIDDAYNANPESMAAALKVLAICKGERRIAILGDMKELGPSAEDMHADLADLEVFNEIDIIHLVGPLMRALYLKLPEKRRGIHVNSASEMVKISSDILKSGDIVLVKASLGTGLGEVVKSILQLRYSQGVSIKKET